MNKHLTISLPSLSCDFRQSDLEIIHDAVEQLYQILPAAPSFSGLRVRVTSLLDALEASRHLLPSETSPRKLEQRRKIALLLDFPPASDWSADHFHAFQHQCHLLSRRMWKLELPCEDQEPLAHVKVCWMNVRESIDRMIAR